MDRRSAIRAMGALLTSAAVIPFINIVPVVPDPLFLIENCLLRLDASQIAGIGDGEPVDVWQDKSVLTDAEIDIFEAYLMEKWGVDGQT